MQIKRVSKNKEVNSLDIKYIVMNCHNDGNSCVSDKQAYTLLLALSACLGIESHLVDKLLF